MTLSESLLTGSRPCLIQAASWRPCFCDPVNIYLTCSRLGAIPRPSGVENDSEAALNLLGHRAVMNSRRTQEKLLVAHHAKCLPGQTSFFRSQNWPPMHLSFIRQITTEHLLSVGSVLGAEIATLKQNNVLGPCASYMPVGNRQAANNKHNK